MKRILVIRRDNIGDLVCTLPLLDALQTQLPDSELYAYVNRYNAPILAHYVGVHGGLSGYWAYQKAKHRQANESRLGMVWQRWRQAQQMRAKAFDVVLLAGGVNASTLHWAQWLRPKKILRQDQLLEFAGVHEVERTCSLLTALGLSYAAPIARLQAQPEFVQQIQQTLASDFPARSVALHLSARKPSQRWAAENFVQLAQWLCQQGYGVLLFWAPGAASDPHHPGDDEKMVRVLQGCAGLPVQALATHTLDALIAGLSLADAVVCADGGAMHVAAALGKPLVALFGDSDPARWRPWGVPAIVLQDATRSVAALSLAQVQAAWQQLQAGPRSF